MKKLYFDRIIIFLFLFMSIISCGYRYTVIDTPDNSSSSIPAKPTENNNEYNPSKDKSNIVSILKKSTMKTYEHDLGFSIDIPDYFVKRDINSKLIEYTWTNEDNVLINFKLSLNSLTDNNKSNISKTKNYLQKYGNIDWDAETPCTKKFLKKVNAFSGNQVSGKLDNKNYINSFVILELYKQKIEKKSKKKTKKIKEESESAGIQSISVILIGYISIPKSDFETYGNHNDSFNYISEIFDLIYLK